MTSSRTRIKICGLTREADVDDAVAAGADAIGMVFYAASARCVGLERAVELTRRLPPFVVPVGLFVNASADAVRRTIAAIPHLLLQFHGDETPAECRHGGRPFIRAARVEPGLDLLNFAAQFSDAQALLLDTHAAGYGGSGRVFDWSLIPAGLACPVVLSGGLSAANVGEGILQVRPWAVDVSTGVESSKGIKDPAAMRRFCNAVREADRIRLEHAPAAE